MVETIILGDCLVALKNIPSETIRLVIADPPFNIGKDYGVYKDNRSSIEYFEWCQTWLRECIRILDTAGSLYLFNYPENNAHLLPFIQERLYFKRWLTWHYPTNTGHSPTNYTRSQHSIIFATKTENAVFNRDAIAEPYKNPNDKRILERIANGSVGRAPYDVFNVNLVKNVSKDKTAHPCQIPVPLLETFIKASSNEGDTVLDPFAGSFSTAVAAKRLKRNLFMIEINSEFIAIGRQRLEACQ